MHDHNTLFLLLYVAGEYYPSFWYHIIPSKGVNSTWNNTEMQYETSLIADSASQWIEDVVAEDSIRPFFLYVRKVPSMYMNSRVLVVCTPPTPSAGVGAPPSAFSLSRLHSTVWNLC